MPNVAFAMLTALAGSLPSAPGTIGLGVDDVDGKLVVTKVVDGGPAASVLRKGDVIVEVGGTPCPNEGAFASIMSGTRPGEMITVVTEDGAHDIVLAGGPQKPQRQRDWRRERAVAVAVAVANVEPPRSLGKLVVGPLLLASSVAGIVTTTLYFAVGLELGGIAAAFGTVAALGMGTWFTVVGAIREKKYKRWQAAQGLVVAPTVSADGAGVALGMQF